MKGFVYKIEYVGDETKEEIVIIISVRFVIMEESLLENDHFKDTSKPNIHHKRFIRQTFYKSKIELK